MNTLKINIFSLLSSWSSYSLPSKKMSSTPNDNQKKTSKKKPSEESSSKEDLFSFEETISIYYLPVHLM